MINKEINTKQHTALSCAVQLMTNKYSEKFWFTKNINGSIQGNTITIMGDLDIFNSEVYEKVIEFNGKKEKYTIILKPLKIN